MVSNLKSDALFDHCFVQMRPIVLALISTLASILCAADVRAASDITVASYYFGNYHPGDARNSKLKGPQWSEWDLVKAARPRFPGHLQPKVPLWGYTDESDPTVMAQKIAAAADHGIDAFIFDWYYYDDGPFLQDTIDKGYLGAPNRERLKFALMWANHDWLDIHPVRKGVTPKLLYPGRVTPAHFVGITNHVISAYFKQPTYWRIDGKPYFSIYDLQNLVAGFGTVHATRVALDAFRARVIRAGFPGLHLNVVAWGKPALPSGKPADLPALVQDLGFDSVTSYVWIHHANLPDLQTDYNLVRDEYFSYWDRATRMFSVPYFPNVTMGWDGTPRGYQILGGTNTIAGNTPERFGEALELTKQRLERQSRGPKVVTLNCWNEWTEGSYLEPDTTNGLAYLDQVRRVFGSH